MAALTPEALAVAVGSAWADVVVRLESTDGSSVRWNQGELADAFVVSLARHLGLPTPSAGSVSGATDGAWLRLDPGDTELARPARVWLSGGGDRGEDEIVRLRWLPRNIYRATGFLLHLRRDCADLEAERRRTDPRLPRWVCFVDTVGVADGRVVKDLELRAPAVQVVAWSSRHGRLRS